MNPASEFSKKTFETFVVRTVTQMIGVAMGIIIGRTLGPAGKGVFAYATTVLALLVTLSGGASAAVSRQYGRLKYPSGRVYGAMLRVFFFTAVPIALALAASGLVLHQVAIVAAAAVFPFTYITQVTISFALSEGEVRWPNVQGLTITAGSTILAGAACLLTHSAAWALAGWGAAIAIMSAVSLRRIVPYAKERGEGEQPDQTVVMREQFKFGLRVTINQLLGLLNFQVDIFIVLYMLGHASLGVYSVAVGLGQLMWNLSRPLAVTSYGRMTSGTPREAATVTASCVRHALLSVGAACIVLFFAGPWLIVAVYGAAFAKAGLALQVLLPGIIAYCMVPFFSQYFTLQLGRPGINTAVTATSTLLCAICTILLIHRFGIVAGAVGTSVSYVASLIICAIIFARAAEVPIASIFVLRRTDLQPYVALARWLVTRVPSRSR